MARILNLQKLETSLENDVTSAGSSSSWAGCACSTSSWTGCGPPDGYLAV